MKNDRRTFIKMAAISGCTNAAAGISCAEAKPKNAAPIIST